MKTHDDDLNAAATPGENPANGAEESEPLDDTSEEQTLSEAALRLRLLGKLVIPRASY